MSLKNLNELNDMHLDVLKEIGNIGQGNAASALSELLQEYINIAVPDIKILDFNEVVGFLGGPENIAVGLMLGISGDIDGMMLCIMQKPFVNHMMKAVLSKETDNLLALDEMDISFINEVGNILTSSYVNAISSMMGININVSVPFISVDMVGAILSVPAVKLAEENCDRALFIDDSFIIGESEIKSNMIFIPELNSLNTLFSRLGVEI